MLSRSAKHLYWLARYVERAENIARMIDVNLDPEVGNPFSVIGVKGLIRAWKAKNVAIVKKIKHLL